MRKNLLIFGGISMLVVSNAYATVAESMVANMVSPAETVIPEHIYTKSVPEFVETDCTGEIYMFNNEFAMSGEETIYPASLFEFERDVIIYSLSWKFNQYEYNSAKTRIQIYLGMCEPGVTNFVKNAPILEGLEKVYDADFNFSPMPLAINEVKFDLDHPYTYNPEKNLVVLVTGLNTGDSTVFPYLQAKWSDGSEGKCSTYAKNKKRDVSFFDHNANTYYVTATMPYITLSYDLAPEEARCDMAAGDITCKATDITVGEPVTFRVDVRNVGNTDVDNFNVEILNVTQEEPTVLATKNVEDVYGPGAEGVESVKLTFENAGEYKIAARIVCDGDSDLENNITEAIDVQVDTTSGVEVAHAGTLGYDAGVLTVGIGNAETLNVFSADGAAVLSVKAAPYIALDLVPGLYVARVCDANGRIYVCKFIVK